MTPAHRALPIALLAALAVVLSGHAPATARDAAPGIALDAASGCDGGAHVPIGGSLPLRLRVDDPAHGDAVPLDLLAVAPDGRRLMLADGAAVAPGVTYALDLPIEGAPGAWRITARTADGEATCAFTADPASGPLLEVTSRIALEASPVGSRDADAALVASEARARRAVTVHNRGDAPLTIHALAIAGGDASPFAVAQDAPLPLVIPAGGARDVLLRYRPVGTDPASDVLVLRTDDPTHSAVGIPLSGWTTGRRPLEATVVTARGCRETGDLPVWFAGEPVAARLTLARDRDGLSDTTLGASTGDFMGDVSAVGLEGMASPALDGQSSTASRLDDRALGALPVAARVTAVRRDGGRSATPLRISGKLASPNGHSAADGPDATIESASDHAVVATRDLQTLVAEASTPDQRVVGTCGVLVAAPSSRVAGSVAAQDDPATVAGLTVVLSGPTAQVAVTDADGAFAFDVAAPGDYVVTVIPPAGRVAAKARFALASAALGHDVAPLAIALTSDPGAEPAAPAQEQPACSVAISPRDGVVNVGQPMAFRATASPTRGTFAYRWTIEGDVIRDYSEGTAARWRTMPLVPTDLDDRTVAFYWRPDDSQRYPRNEGPVAHRVRVEASDGQGGACSDEVTLQVERNATVATRQAEDWYMSNHTRFISREHTLWHDRYPFAAPFYDGSIFFDFHVQFVDRFNRWRAEFGYPPIGMWDPAMPIPTGIEIDHRPRSTGYAGQPRPGWSTLGGGGQRGWNFMPCDWSRGGQRALNQFDRDRRLLGCAVTEVWHNNVHLVIGGDMQDPPTSPRDPVFWRWHRYVDLISRDRLSLWQADLAGDGVLPAAAAARTMAPPRPAVVYQVPFRLYDFVTSLEAIEVTFNAPVTGVTAAALTVGGVPATRVTGAGAGPYRFSGHGDPMGAVTVRLDGRAIRGRDGGMAQDAEWAQTVLPADQDLDGDGLTNGDEIDVVLSRPDVVDSDADGLSDRDEWLRYDTLARWRDSDGDGAADGCEVAARTAPDDPADHAAGCAPEPVWLCGPVRGGGAGR